MPDVLLLLLPDVLVVKVVPTLVLVLLPPALLLLVLVSAMAGKTNDCPSASPLGESYNENTPTIAPKEKRKRDKQ